MNRWPFRAGRKAPINRTHSKGFALAEESADYAVAFGVRAASAPLSQGRLRFDGRADSWRALLSSLNRRLIAAKRHKRHQTRKAELRWSVNGRDGSNISHFHRLTKISFPGGQPPGPVENPSCLRHRRFPSLRFSGSYRTWAQPSASAPRG